jgi:hypothetical protein
VIECSLLPYFRQTPASSGFVDGTWSGTARIRQVSDGPLLRAADRPDQHALTPASTNITDTNAVPRSRFYRIKIHE